MNNNYAQSIPYGLDNDIDINITNTNTNANMNTNYNEMAQYPSAMSMGGTPIVETPQERVIHRNFVHEVPHVCPINTRIVNHHIYRHTYQPRYTCCEQNVMINEQCGSCCQFR